MFPTGRGMFQGEVLWVGQGNYMAAVAEPLLTVAHEALRSLGLGLCPVLKPPLGSLVGLRLGHLFPVTVSAEGVLLDFKQGLMGRTVYIVAGSTGQQPSKQGVVSLRLFLLPQIVTGEADFFQRLLKQGGVLQRFVDFVAESTTQAGCCMFALPPSVGLQHILMAFEADVCLLPRLQLLPADGLFPFPGHVCCTGAMAGLAAAQIRRPVSLHEFLAVVQQSPSPGKVNVANETHLRPCISVRWPGGRLTLLRLGGGTCPPPGCPQRCSY